MASYIICNDKNEVLNLDGVKMFGKKVRVVAIFTEEEDALEVLFAAQEQCGLEHHMVRKVDGNFTTTEV